MKKLMLALSVALSIAGTISNAQAEERSWAWSPLGIGIAAPVQLPYTETDIYGLRLGGLMGVNADMYGVDAGLAEVTDGSMFGLQASGFSWTRGQVIGLQCGAFGNVVHEDVIAFQAGMANVNLGEVSVGMACGVVNYGITYYGLETGLINWNNSSTAGLLVGLGNVGQEDFDGVALGGMSFARRVNGLQLGMFNLADDLSGLQIGLVNAAERVYGLQIGGINMIVNSRVPIMVIANAMF